MARTIILLLAIITGVFCIGSFCFAEVNPVSAISCESSITGGKNISDCTISFGESIFLKNKSENPEGIVKSIWEVEDLNDPSANYIKSRVCCQAGDKTPDCTSFCDKSADIACAACHFSNIFSLVPRHLKIKLTTIDIAGKNEVSEKEVVVNSTPPVSAISCAEPCQVYFDTQKNQLKSLLNLKNNSYDPDGDNEFNDFPYKQKSEWYLKGPHDSDFVYHNSTNSNSGYSLQNVDINSVGLWQAKLVMVDRWGTRSLVNCSKCTANINVISDASAKFECSSNRDVWRACTDFRVKIDGTVYVRDTSLGSQSSTVSDREWSAFYVDGSAVEKLDYSLDQSQKTIVFFKVKELGRITVNLKVKDGAGRSAVDTQVLLSTPILAPQWETKIKDADIY